MSLSEKDRLEIQSSLRWFTEYTFSQNGKDWLYNEHQELLYSALERVVTGGCRRLVINMPPRYSKTEISVVNFIAWSMGMFPDSHFIHASYSKRLAANNAYNARALMMSGSYRDIFPSVKLQGDSKAKDEFRTSNGGVVYATGAGGTITGYGAGRPGKGFGGAIIIDDPHKAGEADSDIRRQNVIEWYSSTIESRCNNQDTPIIVIMQRLHEADLAGWLLDGGTGEGWEHLCIPAISDDGTALWPDKHSIESLRRMEAADPYTFAGQYMQTPSPKAGGIFKREWLTYYDKEPESVIRIVQSWDTAFKASQLNDPSACTTWAQTKGGYYLLDCFVGRLEYPALKAKAKELADRYRPHALVIEDKASGQSLIQDLRVETSHPVIAITPDADKETRASVVTPLFESGMINLPASATWLASLIGELMAFPRGKHDDQVDSVCQALRYMRDGAKMQKMKLGGV